MAVHGLIRRLREFIPSGSDYDDKLAREAADEIERLNAARVEDAKRILKMSDDYERLDDENGRLTAALQEARGDLPVGDAEPVDQVEHRGKK